MLHGSSAVLWYVKNNMPIEEYIITLFCNRDVAVSLMNRGVYSQLVLETMQNPHFLQLQI